MDTSKLIIIVEDVYLDYGLPLVFLTSFLEITPLGWMVPGGTLLTLGGFFAYGRPYYLFAIIVFGWLGAWITFIGAYFLGAGAAKKLHIKLKQNKNAEKAKVLLNNHGPAILTTSMLASITRFWVAFAAGATKYKMSKFLFYSGIASLTWTSLMVTIGFLAGSERERLEGVIGSLGIISWVLFLIAALILYLKVRNEFNQYKEE